MELFNDGLAGEITKHADGIKFPDVEIEPFLLAEMSSVKIEKYIFVLQVVVGLLLFEVFVCVLDDLRELVGRELSKRAVLENGTHVIEYFI